MTSFAYQAVNAAGKSCRGTLSVASQNEALQRIARWAVSHEGDARQAAREERAPNPSRAATCLRA